MFLTRLSRKFLLGNCENIGMLYALTKIHVGIVISPVELTTFLLRIRYLNSFDCRNTSGKNRYSTTLNSRASILFLPNAKQSMTLSMYNSVVTVDRKWIFNPAHDTEASLIVVGFWPSAIAHLVFYLSTSKLVDLSSSSGRSLLNACNILSKISLVNQTALGG